jgi:hypothetical protein
MKLKAWKLVVALLFLLLITLLIMRHFSNSNQMLTFLVSKKNYSLILTNSNQTFDIPFYVSKTHTMYTNKNAIESIHLMNHNQSNIVQLELIDIYRDNQEIIVDTKRYFAYRLTLKTNIEYNNMLDIIHFNVASLRMHYQNGEEITLFIGNVSLTKVDKLGTLNQLENDVKISSLKGLVNHIDGISTLVGIEMQLTKQSIVDVTIKRIGLVHNSIGINHDLIRHNNPINHSDDLAHEVFGTTYHIFNMSENTTFDYLMDTNIVRLTIPLYYNDVISFENELGIYIVYEIDNNIKYYIYGSFCFFNTSNRIHEWVKYEYERY